MKELALHILDIANNSISAKALKLEIRVNENLIDDLFEIIIIDNGHGMTEEFLKHVSDPFFTTRKERKVGLGISLLKQNMEMAEGVLKIHSELMKGTKIMASCKHSHIDRPVLGDIEGVVVILASNEKVELIYKHQINNDVYEFNSKEVSEALGGTPLSLPQVSKYLKEMIRENIEELRVKHCRAKI